MNNSSIKHIADLTNSIRHYLDAEKMAHLALRPAQEDESPVISLIDTLLTRAIQQNTSDIHIEPFHNDYRIRMRQDGILYETLTLPHSLAQRVISRLKIMANLDIAERRLPQDGRIKSPHLENNTDYRISTCPTLKGEKIVLRLLKKSSSAITIENLGLNTTQKSLLLQTIKQPSGLILVTGPTGSGKTATLYSILSELNSETINIVTVEDPIEIELTGINQVNTHSKIGFDFSHALRSLLRQDPDIIMIGEIRDYETAEIAIKAAQTGHLVLATIHTHNTVETINRLLTMGIAPYQLASTIKLIIAQRLVRKLCEPCKIEINEHFVENKAGCELCFGGYKDRIGIFELLPILDNIAKLISSNASALDLLEKAKENGLVTLLQSGTEKINQGITTLTEIFRVAQE